jgi:hypothetical protein
VPYRITFVFDSASGTSNKDAAVMRESVRHCLRALAACNTAYLRTHADVPSLVGSGVLLDDAPTHDEWQDVGTTLKTGIGSWVDLAAWRTAELRVRHGQRGIAPVFKPDYASTAGLGRITFVLDSFPSLTPVDRQNAHTAIAYCLRALTASNVAYLRAHPETPRLFQSGVVYQEEPPGAEDWADIGTCRKLGWGDCFPTGTLLLKDDMTLVPVDEIQVGDRIWGRDAWTQVEAKVAKGTLSVDVVLTNSGDAIKLTSDHHFFVGRCSKHGRDCSCPLSERTTERVPLRELQPRDVLVSPEHLPWKRPEVHQRLRQCVDILRVRAVETDIFEAPCFDIQTSDHYVYLPEQDVTVSNCEDLACWRAAELQVFEGIRAYPTFLWRARPRGGALYHIQVRYPDDRVEDPSRRLGMR